MKSIFYPFSTPFKVFLNTWIKIEVMANRGVIVLLIMSTVLYFMIIIEHNRYSATEQIIVGARPVFLTIILVYAVNTVYTVHSHAIYCIYCTFIFNILYILYIHLNSYSTLICALYSRYNV